jgi:uncharacterized protein YutD
MLVKCSKGMYRVLKNYRDAFKLEEFQEKYLEECFDKYPYIVGDISSTILRLKGFDDNPKSPSFYKNIDKYIEDSCAFGCPYFVLTRIHSEQEYQKLEAEDSDPITTDERFDIKTIQKENFDKESLVLKTTPKSKANIVIDSSKLNNVPKGALPPDLVEIAKTEKNNQNNNRKNNNQAQKEKEPEQTFVSASPDFDPSKKEKKGKFNNNRNKNKHNR